MGGVDPGQQTLLIIDDGIPTWCYLVAGRKRGREISKAGVGIQGGDRIRRHERNGLVLVERWLWSRYEHAEHEETLAVDLARLLGASLDGWITDADVPQRGKSECFDSTALPEVRRLLADRWNVLGPSFLGTAEAGLPASRVPPLGDETAAIPRHATRTV